MIRIAIADDEELFRQGLRSLFSRYDDIAIVTEASDGDALLEALKSELQLPDIILLDLRMKPRNGIDTAKMLKEQYADIKVMVLSSFYEASYLRHMFKIGINAFIPKNTDFQNLIASVRRVYEKGLFFSEDDVQYIHQHAHKKTSSPVMFMSSADLTAREIEILRLICQEYTTPEIAEKLFISARTVEGHRNNLLLKTGAKNTAGLVLYGVMMKLVDIDEKITCLTLRS